MRTDSAHEAIHDAPFANSAQNLPASRDGRFFHPGNRGDSAYTNRNCEGPAGTSAQEAQAVDAESAATSIVQAENVTWTKWIVAYLFDCVHPHTTWPQCGRGGLDYVCCLDCGKEFPYSTRSMRIVSSDQPLKDRRQCSGQTLELMDSPPRSYKWRTAGPPRIN